MGVGDVVGSSHGSMLRCTGREETESERTAKRATMRYENMATWLTFFFFALSLYCPGCGVI